VNLIESRRAAQPGTTSAAAAGTFATSQESRMFARVITAQAGPQGFDSFIGLARDQLPGASQQPGFKGFYLLTDAGTGKVITISLWDTREQMAAVEASGARMTSRAAPATGLTPLQRETYEVSMQA
jgi:heme-degrading monooxygenase HmoA